eukprot:753030-Hanusia_phi.AAC.5
MSLPSSSQCAPRLGHGEAPQLHPRAMASSPHRLSEADLFLESGEKGTSSVAASFHEKLPDKSCLV